jgi:L-ascorbate metabolism protein UlaG (beta-lactamase superfamily)
MKTVMNQPILENDAFLADVERVRADAGALHIWWLGQSGFLLQSPQGHLLLDPYLSDSLTEKYANTDMPHVRMTERVVDPARLDFIDIVTSSHSHTDHLDAATLKPLRSVNPALALVIPEAHRALVAERLLCPQDWPLGIDAGQAVTVKGIRFTGVPAAHEQVERDAQGHHKYLGYIVAGDGWTIYHSGDTVLYPEMVEILRQWPIDVALLPINGRVPGQRVAGNLDGREAAELAHAIGARVAIPCHYDMFAFNTATPALFVETCRALDQSFVVLQNGERWTLPALR